LGHSQNKDLPNKRFCHFCGIRSPVFVLVFMFKSLRLGLAPHFRFLLAVHGLLLVIYSTFRYVMLAYNRPTYFSDMERSMSLPKAFRIGFGFDVTVASYALLVPYVLLTYAYFRPHHAERLYRWVRVWCGVAILVSLIICAADVPYFKYYNSRLNTATVHLKNMAQILEFIFKEVKYYPFLAILVVGFWGIGRLVRLVWSRTWSSAAPVSFSKKMTATALASLVLVCGLWGGPTPKRPDMKSATFSNDGFINQLTLNPVHTWFDSYFAFDISVESRTKALARVRKALGIDPTAPTEAAIRRQHAFDAPPRRMNVVLVLMESMSADRVSDTLTPGLAALQRKSIWFDQCYSNGIHTNAGIYSTLYSMPIMMMQHPMINGAAEHTEFRGLPGTLRDAGYRTRFFCTHPKSFDNLDIFLQNNGFQHVSDQYEYPAADVANAWGVGDEPLTRHALGQLDSMAHDGSGQPFFATVLTISTHPPYTLPANTTFHPRRTDPVLATYEYADWAISSFIEACATKDWYQNTIFVLVGDHGVNLTNYPTDVSLSYNHVPLIIHAPGLFAQPEVRHDLANQTDIFPTVMGLLQEDYTQNSMGYDLFREQRPFAFFSQDHRLCVLNHQYLYVARKSGSESLYDLRSLRPSELKKYHPTLADSMKNYACAHLHVAQWMVEQKLTK
jgi:phosphoglycerol transferase MdoB-like AlkP superfamily enzyme